MSNEFTAIHLPSKYKIYDGVEPGTIRVRTFLGEDEELAVTLGYGNTKKKILDLFRNVLVGIDPLKLTSGDVEYILLWEAINSYSKDFPIILRCDACRQQIETTVDLSTLNVKELPDNFTQPQDIPLKSGVVKLRLLTLADNIAVFDNAEKGIDPYLFSYAVGMVDENLNALARLELLKKMDTHDFAKIRQFYYLHEHGPEYTTGYICSKCGEEGETIVPFRIEQSIRNGEVVGPNMGT